MVSPHINTEDLSVGDHVFVSWKPDRCCTFRYLGDMKFILGEPLYLSDLIQKNNPPVTFVVGNKDGLCKLKKLEKASMA